MSTAGPTMEMKKFQASIRPHKRAILEGTLLAIDPGSISLGWAWYEMGNLVISGEYKVPRSVPPHKRLAQIMDELAKWTGPEVMVVEKMFRYNASLVWAVGGSIVTARPDFLIEIPIRVWSYYKDDKYEKSDEADALLMGKATIDLARNLK